MKKLIFSVLVAVLISFTSTACNVGNSDIAESTLLAASSIRRFTDVEPSECMEWQCKSDGIIFPPFP